MKNLKLTAILLSIFLIVSCGDKEPITPTTEDLILGTWVITDVTATGDVKMDIQGLDVSMIFDGKNKNSDMFLNFTKDGEYTTGGNLTMTLDLYSDGNLVSSEDMNLIEEGVDEEVGTWTAENDKVILDGESINTIVFIDNNNFIMNTKNIMDGVPMDGLAVDMDMNMIYTFTKQ